MHSNAENPAQRRHRGFSALLAFPVVKILKGSPLVRDAADFFLLYALAASRVYRSGNGKSKKLQVTGIAKQIISKNDLRPERGWTIAAADAVAFTFWTTL
jgi:hypothetical protein